MFYLFHFFRRPHIDTAQIRNNLMILANVAKKEYAKDAWQRVQRIVREVEKWER